MSNHEGKQTAFHQLFGQEVKLSSKEESAASVLTQVRALVNYIYSIIQTLKMSCLELRPDLGQVSDCLGSKPRDFFRHRRGLVFFCEIPSMVCKGFVIQHGRRC